ncbi:glycerate kinase [Rhopalosiphum padi]|uniref:glycerate kinase n=1 Tax=Rhopalosiphum padi TaxID=40932 RepID=UPI00298EA43B|nr:glycerate kinase [Rhopalosiphum padi]XP_060836651.1 glycerate kinase [Rhopalosiphum padi]
MCSEHDRLADMKKYAVKVFEECVRSVSPRNIVRNALRFDSKKLYVDCSAYSVPGDVYVVGFGKAVLNMALEVEDVLNGRLGEAVVSVPFGTRWPAKPEHSRVCAMEAARNNVPDQQSVDNTDRIARTVSRLRSGDLLVVLISGGGSALLCSPTVPLGDKILATKLLSSAGASIEQLNAVRKALSRVKGGRLIGSVRPECPVVSLILSDVVGDPLTAIASGPTVPNGDPDHLPMNIVDGFGLRDQMPGTVVDALLRNTSFTGTAAQFDRVHNHVIGNNAIALRAGVQYAGRDFGAVLLTTSIRGDVAAVSTFYSDLVAYVCDVYADGAADAKRKERLKISSTSVVGGGVDVEHLTGSVVEASSRGRGLCILSGGEPTVVVRGSGLGGRNQELALRVAMDLATARRRHDSLCRFDVLFFSGGTDGIDGPTDACGAFGYPALVNAALSRGLDPSRYVHDNDSYGFYSALDLGRDGGGVGDLLKIGHTGTNVMDVHVLIVKPK